MKKINTDSPAGSSFGTASISIPSHCVGGDCGVGPPSWSDLRHWIPGRAFETAAHEADNVGRRGSCLSSTGRGGVLWPWELPALLPWREWAGNRRLAMLARLLRFLAALTRPRREEVLGAPNASMLCFWGREAGSMSDIGLGLGTGLDGRSDQCVAGGVVRDKTSKMTRETG